MRSGTLNTYVRGQGSYPRSAFVQDNTEPGGFKIKKGSRAVRLTSQQMDKKFRTSVKVKTKKIEGLLINNATYSGYVIGPEEGDPHQVDFHAETGWVNADDGVEQATPVIVDSMNIAIEQFIKELAGQ